MSLVARITSLAARVRDQFISIAPRLLPGGGSVGQVLVKTTADDYAVAWQTSSGGGGGGTDIHVGPTPPSAPVDGQLWLQTL